MVADALLMPCWIWDERWVSGGREGEVPFKLSMTKNITAHLKSGGEVPLSSMEHFGGLNFANL